MINRIAIIADNSRAMVKALLELWLQNMSVAIIDWRIPVASGVNLLRSATITRCYIDERILDAYCSADPNLDAIPLKAETFCQKLGDEVYDLWNGINHESEEEALVLFSSGTTGTSKGIRLSYRGLWANVNQIMSYIGGGEFHRLLISKTLAHSSTITGELLVGLQCGWEIYIAPTITTISKIYGMMEELSISLYCTNPTLLSLLLKHAQQKKRVNTKLRYLYVSGAVMPYVLYHESKSVFVEASVYNVYGLTEAGPRVSAQGINSRFQPYSVGHTLPGVEVKILTESDGQGEILVYSPALALSYLNKNLEFSTQYPRYIHTHDYGYIDKNGELYVLGRVDDMIISGAHNVFPSTVEECLMKMRGVVNCLVFGIAHSVLGEAVACCIESTGSISSSDVMKHCQKYLAPYECPQKIYIVDHIPTTENGKKSRRLAKEMFGV